MCFGSGIALHASTRADVVPAFVTTSTVRTSLSQRRYVVQSTRTQSSVNDGDDAKSVMVLKQWSNGERGLKAVQLGETEFHCDAAYHDGVAYVLLAESGWEGNNNSTNNHSNCNGDGLTCRVATQKGSWRLVQDSASADELSQNVFSTFINHGDLANNSSNHCYAYRIIPGIDRNGNDLKHSTTTTSSTDTAPSMTLQQRLEIESSTTECRVLSNTTQLQAISLFSKQTTMGIFHQGGSTLCGSHLTTSITTDVPCALTIRTINPTVHCMAVADPSQTLFHVVVTLSGFFQVERESNTGSVKMQKDMDQQGEQKCSSSSSSSSSSVGGGACSSDIVQVIHFEIENDQIMTSVSISLPTGILAGKSTTLLLVGETKGG